MAAREEEKKPAAAESPEKEDAREGAEEAAEAKPERKNPTIISQLLVPDALVRIGVGILALGGMTAGAFLLITDVIGPSLGPVEQAQVTGTAADTNVPEVAAAPGDQYMVDDIIINPAGTRGKRFLRLGFALETGDGPTVVAELETRRAQVRDLFIRKFSTRTLDEIGDPMVREEIRLSCIEELNAMLIAGEVSNLYFTDYVLQ
jgi:flagellar FliL protein